MRTQVAALQTAIIAAKAAQKEAQMECKRLEKEMDEFKNNRESKLEQLRKDIAKKKKDLTTQTGAVKVMQREVQTVELELEQMDKDLASAKEEILAAHRTTENSKVEYTLLQKSISETQAEHDRIEVQLREETKLLSAFAKELDELDRFKKVKEADIANLDVEERKIGHELEKMAVESKKNEQSLRALADKYAWIEEESS